MYITPSPNISFRRQKGAALIVALILLTAITVIGLSNMQSSSLEAKMVSSQSQRLHAFARAEAGLRRTENILETELNLSYEDLFSDRCPSGYCFSSDCGSGTGTGTGTGSGSGSGDSCSCPDGFCFFGEYEFTDTSKLDCEVGTNGIGVVRPEYWMNEDNWTDSTKHASYTYTENTEEITIKYMIEFSCFVGENIYSDPTTGDPLFLITVLHEPNVGQPVMLQSTYSFEINR